MTDTQSKPASNWPRSILWLVVVAFGVFYLNAMRERGLGEAAKLEAQQAAPAISVAGIAGRPRDAGATATPDAGDSPLPVVTAPAQAVTASATPPPSAPVMAPPEPGTAASTTSGAGVSAPVRAPGPTAQQAASAMPPAAPVSQLGSPMAPPSAMRGWVDPHRASVEQRRAQLLAEYWALWRAVERERRRIWEEMTRLGVAPTAGSEPAFPYPLPYPFSDLPSPMQGSVPSPGPATAPSQRWQPAER